MGRLHRQRERRLSKDINHFVLSDNEAIDWGSVVERAGLYVSGDNNFTVSVRGGEGYFREICQRRHTCRQPKSTPWSKAYRIFDDREPSVFYASGTGDLGILSIGGINTNSTAPFALPRHLSSIRAWLTNKSVQSSGLMAR